jgi:phospholipid/cholesterol/gamma-HCH transport system substrate-binding protein
MENKSHALLAGVFTLALLAAAIYIGLWLNRDRTEWVPYQIATKLSIPGLNTQAAVRYRGLDVGKVDDIRFDPRQPGQLLVRIQVRPDTPVTRSTYATLGYQGVTGIAYVELDDDGSQPTLLPSSEQNPARIAMRPSVFDQLQNRGLAILEQTQQVTLRLNRLLEPANQKAILAAFDNVSNAASEVAAIPRQLQPTLAKMPALADQAQRTLGEIDRLSRAAGSLADSLGAMSAKLQAPNGALDRIGDAADQVGAVADKLQHQTLPLANDARTTIRSLNHTLENLNERPQSLLFGSPKMTPGPGEPGFDASK